MKSMKPVPCIVCNKVLEESIPDGINQPYKGTTFTTHGHYGSIFFDPIDNSCLEINVCDDCLEEARANKKIVYYTGNKVKLY